LSVSSLSSPNQSQGWQQHFKNRIWLRQGTQTLRQVQSPLTAMIGKWLLGDTSGLSGESDRSAPSNAKKERSDRRKNLSCAVILVGIQGRDSTTE